MLKTIATSLICAIAVVLTFSFVQPHALSGAAGTEHTSEDHFYSGLTTQYAINNGAVVNITTTSTLTNAQVCGGGPIYINNTTGSIALTLPAATSTNGLGNRLGCLRYDGEFISGLIFNQSTNTVTFATSTGDYMAQAWNNSTTLPTLNNVTGLFPSAEYYIVRVSSSTNRYYFTKFGPDQ